MSEPTRVLTAHLTRHLEVEQRELAEQPTAVMCGRLEVADIPAWIGPAFGQVMAAMSADGVVSVGPPFARLARVEGMPTTFDIEAGFPGSRPLAAHPGAVVQPSRLPGGPAAVILHLGPYDAMLPTYQALDRWLAEHGLVAEGAPWECFFSEPEGDAATWRTEIVQPYRDAA